MIFRVTDPPRISFPVDGLEDIERIAVTSKREKE